MTAPQYPGKIFMYPCAGNDISEPVQVFGEFYDTFLFVDLNYRGDDKQPKIPGWKEVRGSQRRFGSPNSSIRHLQDGRCRYRLIDPEWFLTDYVNETTGRQILIVRRRGFGQYALHELRDGSLSMFMHRGDSSGDGGSNVFYLANRRTSYRPISNLLDLIKRKMTAPACIASDGSNTSIAELSHAANGAGAIESFTSHGLTWRLRTVSGRLSSRTKVWEVSSQDMGHQI
jgi:hypothetical protein